MSSLSTHVLDTANGCPAEGVDIILYREDDGSWTPVGRGTTDLDGRAPDVGNSTGITQGMWKLSFDAGGYFAARGQECFYGVVDVVFNIRDDSHHHVPLLVSPYGYSTYRGS